MNHLSAGLWPAVAAPASEARDLAQRVALAQAKAAPDPHRVIEHDGFAARILKAVARRPTGIDRALA